MNGTRHLLGSDPFRKSYLLGSETFIFFYFFMGGGEMERKDGQENSITDLRKFFEEGARPLVQHEFITFWQSLSEEDKIEFKRADLNA